MSPRQLQAAFAILAACPMALIVYSESVLDPVSMFSSVYGLLVVGETLLLLSFAVLLARLLEGRFAPALGRGVRLPWPARALAWVGLGVGLGFFVFWVAIDLVSGYGSFPDTAFVAHPLLLAVYNRSGLGGLPLPDRDRTIGFFSFVLADAAFIAIRLGRGVGRAVRDGVCFFAAPILLAFELALWYRAPAEMYWHAAAFLPWSLGRFLTPREFLDATYSPLTFVWGGNVYAFSNWLVLVAACGFLALAVAPAWRGGRQAEGWAREARSTRTLERRGTDRCAEASLSTCCFRAARTCAGG